MENQNIFDFCKAREEENKTLQFSVFFLFSLMMIFVGAYMLMLIVGMACSLQASTGLFGICFVITFFVALFSSPSWGPIIFS